MRGNKGITLIALVITIIVMLILVTVTISIASQGNLFKHAGNAAAGTKKAVQEEETLQNGVIDGKDMQVYVNDLITNTSSN